MWVLKNNSVEPERVIYLHCGKRLTVSRKQGHILLLNDQSISRDHASITVTHMPQNLGDITKLPEVVLFDSGSKFGTFLNDGITKGTKIQERTPVAISHGDKIRFGLFKNTWILTYEKLIVTTTVLDEEEKQPLNNLLLWLGGHLLKDWSSDCTHLITTQLKLTPKAVCALAAAIPVVTLQYLEKLKSNIIENFGLPDVKNFIPDLLEPGISKQSISLIPNIERRLLLKDKIVVFCSNSSMRKLSPVVELIGGKPVSFNKTIAEDITDSKYILIKPRRELLQNATYPREIIQALEDLKRVGLTAITESDIGLAVMYVSTDKYCNPSFSMSSLLKSSASVNTERQTQVLPVFATETQSVDLVPNAQPKNSQVKIIPESGRSSVPTPSNSAAPPPSNTAAPPPSNDLGDQDYNQYSDTEMLDTIAVETCKTELIDLTDIDKENTQNFSSKKRLRKDSNDANSASKRKSIRADRDIPFQSVNDSCITKPQKPIDDIEIAPVGNFLPRHTSTQNVDSGKVNTKHGTKDNETNIRNPTATNANDLSLTKKAINPASFAPYTLPSIALPSVNPYTVDHELPSISMIKDEPTSQVEEEGSLNWLQKMTETKNNQVKSETANSQKRNRNVDKTTNVSPVKNEILSNTQDSGRKRTRELMSPTPIPTREVKRERLSSKVDDEFVLPVSNPRSRRRGRNDLTQANQVNKSQSNTQVSNTDVVKKIIPETAETSAAPSTGDSSTMANAQVKEEQVSAKLSCSTPTPSPFINKANNCDGKKPAAEVKNEDDEDMRKLEASFTKIQFVSLVIRSTVNNPNESNVQPSNSNVKNFKRFKKNATLNNTCIRIIGGQDLVAHVDMDESRRDDFFSSHPESRRFIEQQEEDHDEQTMNDDLFNLPVVVNRNRGRAR